MSFKTTEFINNVFDELNQNHYEKDYKALDRLCKKIDVVKEVFSEYTDDLSKAKSTEIISLESYTKFLKVILFYSANDLKYFNSALKLYDKIKNEIDRDNQKDIEQNIESIFKGMQ
ncbi:hypothetical protein N5T90_09570 [Aliarcobacter cryaerophilus]|uniref:hypothetical protein n=1 Tax=Aliarcobacter cryaerophilus TaxID=28198 RepID=UPI0021B62980|nr:hypothetical protein [Aliarcobacter cryaerophilus]MCT7471123.1 hypothetical protein [Aliarcobacter cryaerophilus]